MYKVIPSLLTPQPPGHLNMGKYYRQSLSSIILQDIHTKVASVLVLITSHTPVYARPFTPSTLSEICDAIPGGGVMSHDWFNKTIQ